MKGGVWLRSSALGQLQKGKKAGAAATFYCFRGGVSWPNHVVFYSSGGKIIGHSDLGTVLKSDRAWVRKIWVKNRTVYVQVYGVVEAQECNACATGSALLQYRWSAKKHRMVLVKKTRYNAKTYAKRIASAINSGRLATARKYSDREVVRQLAASHRRLVAGSCSLVDDGSYMCKINAYRGRNNLPAFIFLKPSGWNTWRAYDIK